MTSLGRTGMASSRHIEIAKGLIDQLIGVQATTNPPHLPQINHLGIPGPTQQQVRTALHPSQAR